MRRPDPLTRAVAEPTPDRILIVRIEEQYQRLPVSQATVLVNATVVAVVLGRAVPIRSWLALTVVLAALRLGAWALHRMRPAGWSVRRWAALHVAGAAANGVLWGALPAFFFAPLGVPEQLFLAVVIAGMMAGAASATLGWSPPFVAFTVPALAPLIFRLLGSATVLERATGVLGCILGAAIWALARKAERDLTASLGHRFRNDALVEELSAAGRELTEVNAGLEEAVRQRTGELVEAERRMAQSALMASVGSLAAALAHDINNPLASLLSCLRVVEDEAVSAPGLLSANAREALEDLRACAERVRGSVRSLRDVVRVDAKEAALDLREVVESCLAVAAPELRTRVRVVREQLETGSVLAERGTLSQALLGLVLHVARSVPPGDPERNELRIAIRVVPGELVSLELRRHPPPEGDPAAPDVAQGVSPFHLAVARFGGSVQVRVDGCGLVVTLPVGQGARGAEAG